MITATKCRELAKSYRNCAEKTRVVRKMHLLHNISHSLGGPASQLEALADEERSRSRTVPKPCIPESGALKNPAQGRRS